VRKICQLHHKKLVIKLSQDHSEATIRKKLIYFELEELIRNKEETELYIKKLEERLSDYTTDIPKRTVTNEQEPEAINDSIFY